MHRRSGETPVSGIVAGTRIEAMLRLGFCLLLATISLDDSYGQPTSPGAKLIPVRLLTDWYPEPEHGGFYNALVRGYYRAEGLEVTIVPGRPNKSTTELVSTGAGESGLAGSDQVLVDISRGLDLIAVGATMQQDPQAIMLHEDDPAMSFKDLDGRAVAVAPSSIWFQFLAQKFNLVHVKEVPVAFSVDTFLREPRYIQQVFVTAEPFFVEEAEAAKPKIWLIKDTGYAPYRVIFTTRKYLTENPEIVRSFVAASVRGWRDYIKDPSAANIEIAALNPEMDLKRMIFSWQALKEGEFVYGPDPSGAIVGKFDPQRWTDMYKILRGLNVITVDIDPQNAYTLAFVKDL
ncbi:MAG: ABC transporter substrate-binding protein [Chthoniobacterales bacterium]